MEPVPTTETELFNADLECLFSLAKGFLLSESAGAIALQQGSNQLKYLQTPSGVTLRSIEDTSQKNPLFLLQALEPASGFLDGSTRHGVVAWSKDSHQSGTVNVRKINSTGEWTESSAVLLELKRETVNTIADLLLKDAMHVPLAETQAT